MIKSTTKTLVLLALALPLSLQAQCGQGKSTNDKMPMQEMNVSKVTIDAHKANSAAFTLLATMNMKESYEGMIKRITNMQVNAKPELKAIAPMIEAFFTKYMGWEAQRGDIAALYAKNYTSKELEALSKFYQTPLGQKTVQIMPQLAAASAQIGQSRMMKHMPEMKAMIDAELKKVNTKK
ncbi:hypothetical protein MNB_SV-13-68 [hydrothermal vent metagenome]|uniref:DUF2059 domain-containing protein n=1 Tax=hydrothermal vent metagenome TaxID=652676 RepID=A0A1W1D021_9ZZZZ